MSKDVDMLCSDPNYTKSTTMDLLKGDPVQSLHFPHSTKS